MKTFLLACLLALSTLPTLGAAEQSLADKVEQAEKTHLEAVDQADKALAAGCTPYDHVFARFSSIDALVVKLVEYRKQAEIDGDEALATTITERLETAQQELAEWKEKYESQM